MRAAEIVERGREAPGQSSVARSRIDAALESVAEASRHGRSTDLDLLRSELQGSPDADTIDEALARVGRMRAAMEEDEPIYDFLDPAGVKEILARQEFREALDAEEKEPSRFWTRLREILDAMLGPLELLSLPLRIVGALIVAAFVTTVAIAVARMRRREQAPATAPAVVVAPRLRNATSRDQVARAAAAAERGDWPAAISLAGAAAMAALSERGLLRSSAGATNGEARRSVESRAERAELLPLLAATLDAVDAVAYGGRPATEPLARAAIDGARRLAPGP